MEEKIDRILALLEENNEILKEIKSKIEMSESEECVTKRTLHDFINNVVADLFADMLLQPKGRGHIASVSEYGTKKYIGSFKTEKEAYNAYKKAKELYIKEIADKYFQCGKISERLYNSMYNYKVEEND